MGPPPGTALRFWSWHRAVVWCEWGARNSAAPKCDPPFPADLTADELTKVGVALVAMTEAEPRDDADRELRTHWDDSQGRPLWDMDLQGPSQAQGNKAGVAGRIGGYPVYLNSDMDQPTATAKRVVLFGDYKSYKIQDAGGPLFMRSDELRMLNGEIVFLAFRRSDGALANPQAIKYLRTL